MTRNSAEKKTQKSHKYLLIAFPLLASLALAQHGRQKTDNSSRLKTTSSSAKAPPSLESKKTGTQPLRTDLRQKNIPTRSPALATNIEQPKTNESSAPLEKKCSGQKITLENRKVYKNTTIGSDSVCEILLPRLSYIKVIGNVKIVAHNISLQGVINGNANDSGNQNAANLEIIAHKKFEASGTIELRGSSDDKFPLSKGGLVKASAPNIQVSALINLQGTKNEYNGSATFDCGSSECKIYGHNIINSKNEVPNISATQHADEIIHLLENIKELKGRLSSVKSKEVSETLNFSLLQKIKLLKQRRRFLNAKLESNIEKEIEVEAQKNSINASSFMSKVYGAKYFQKKAFSYDPQKSSQAETLIKDLELQILSQLLKKNKNFDLYSWGLEADDSYQLEAKIHEIQSKAIEVYGT